MLLVLATLLAQEPDRGHAFEIVGEELAGREIFVRVVSPDAKTFVAQGEGFADPEPSTFRDSRTGPVYLFRGGRVTVLATRKPPMQAIVAVGNSGRMVGNVVRITKDIVIRPFVLDKGEIQLPLPDYDGSGCPAYQVTGLTANGEILITGWGSHRDENGLFIFGRHGLRRIISIDQSLYHSYTLAETPVGFVGTLSLRVELPSIQPGSRYTSNPGGAYFSETSMRRLEVPGGTRQYLVTAVSPDGEWVAGLGYGVFRRPFIWRNGKPYANFQNVRSLDRLSFSSISQGGEVAVGKVEFGNPLQAVIWTQKEGVESLSAFLKGKKIDVPADWTPIDATGVSADGTLIVGSARNRKGKVRPFILRLPKEEQQQTQPKDLDHDGTSGGGGLSGPSDRKTAGADLPS